MTNDRTLDLVLLEEVRERVRGQAPPTPLDLALEAASADDPEQRARTLLQLATRLRAHGHDDLALKAADAAVRAAGASDAVRAAQIQKVRIHADAGRLAEAQALGEELLAAGHEGPLVRAMAHVYWGRFVETEDESYRALWRSLSSELRQVA